MKRTPLTTLDGLGDEEILAAPDLAAIFKMSRVAIYEALTTGKIPGYFRVGRCVRIQVKDVRAYIDSGRVPKMNSRDRVVQRILNYTPPAKRRRGAA